MVRLLSRQKNKKIFEDLKNVENSEILPFDADNDGDLDLYYSSGSVALNIFPDFI